MKTQNRARISGRTLASVVAFAVLLLFTAPYISTDFAVSGESGHFGMLSSDAVSPSVSLDIISPLNATYKAAEQNGLSQATRSIKHWLYSLQLSLVMALSFSVLKTRGVPCLYSNAVVCSSPISISIGGHAPPFFCA